MSLISVDRISQSRFEHFETHVQDRKMLRIPPNWRWTAWSCVVEMKVSAMRSLQLFGWSTRWVGEMLMSR